MYLNRSESAEEDAAAHFYRLADEFSILFPSRCVSMLEIGTKSCV